MSLTVTQRPNGNGVWVAAKNPIIYKMTRRDYEWTLLVTSSGNTSIRVAGNQTSNFVAGNVIWLQSDDGAYSATGTVVSSAFGTYTTVVTTVPYIADNASGYINTITKRANYYVGVGIYKTSDDTLISTVNYYPTKVGIVTIDVSQPLISVLDPAISQISDGVIFQDSNITEGFYIKYTEYWTGSAESTTNDSANKYYSIYGAKQIGQDSYYSTYNNDVAGSSAIALTSLDTLLLAIDQYYTLSYISPQGGSNDWIKKSWYDSTRTLICKTLIKSTNNTTAYAGTSVPKSVYTIFQKFALSESITPDRNITNGGTTAWASNSITIATGVTSKTWCSPIFIAQNSGQFRINYSLNLSANSTPAVLVTMYLFDSSGNALTLTGGSNNSIGLSSSGPTTGSFSVSPSNGDAYFIGVNAVNATGANRTITINSLSIVIPSSSSSIPTTSVDFNGIILSSGTTYSETGTLFSTIRGNIMSCTKNSITLTWRNNLGGESSWIFNYNQDLVYKFQDPYKNKWMVVYDQNLTLSQYNALNDLFTLGQIYQTPIIELTTSIDKTEARIGQQVYIVDSSGNKTGVVVIPTENKTMTKRNKHNFIATIELPEIFG